MLRKAVIAASTALILSSLSAAVQASITIQQIEAYDDYPTDTNYAPVHFYSKPTVTLGAGDQGGSFPNLTFQELTSLSGDNYSGHANSVGNNIYGASSVAYPFVYNASNTSATNIYCQGFDDFLNNVVMTQNTTGTAVAPGNFAAGVKVVNTSYVVTYGSTSPNTPTTDTDAYRRMDYMIAADNVTLVTGAVTSVGDGNYYDLNWSCYNCVAVSGAQTFSPSSGPGKKHADLYLNEDASFGTGTVSGYAVALYGNAQAGNQSDAMQNIVNRSLLLAGADKVVYTRQTANNLDITHGAGEPDYAASLAILQEGEKTLLPVGTGSTISGTPSTTQNGWAYNTIAARGQDVVLFNSSSPITSVTASLNWNVFSPVSNGNISTSVLTLPDLTLEVRAVTYNSSSGKYILGPSLSDTTLHSTATNDNLQYLYSTTGLAAGNYAFLIDGDSSVSQAVGFSYTLAGNYQSQWNSNAGGSWATSTNWTNGIPDGRSAVAQLLASPGITTPSTITLDGNRILGQLFFSNANSYTLASGANGGTLTLDDTGDPAGTPNPQINVSTGSQIIAVPVISNSIVYPVSLNVAAAASLNLSGGINSGEYIYKNGAGSLFLSNTITATAFAIQGGSVTISPTATLNSGNTYIEAGTTLNFAASSSAGILIRNVALQVYFSSSGTLALAPAAASANRQLLVDTLGITMIGTTNAWISKIDLANNDLDISPTGSSLASVINQIQQGYNGGSWTGTGGIVSSSAAANASHLTALGVIQNNQTGTALFTGSHQFDGYTPSASDILVKYTYYGDANLDGKVDGSDYSLIDNGYLSKLTTWYNGDFNYDGVINGSDYTLIDNAYNRQGAQLSAQLLGPNAAVTDEISAGTNVPEPVSLGLITLGAAAALRRRRHV